MPCLRCFYLAFLFDNGCSSLLAVKKHRIMLAAPLSCCLDKDIKLAYFNTSSFNQSITNQFPNISSRMDKYTEVPYKNPYEPKANEPVFPQVSLFSYCEKLCRPIYPIFRS